MIDLYLIFFLVASLLFGGIVWYSMLLQRGRKHTPKEEYVDPLFAELEDTKTREKDSSLVDTKVPDKVSDKDIESSPEPAVEDTVVEASESKKESSEIETPAVDTMQTPVPESEATFEVDTPNINKPRRDALDRRKRAPRLTDDSSQVPKLPIKGSTRESLPVIEETEPKKFVERAKQGANKVEPTIVEPKTIEPTAVKVTRGKLDQSPVEMNDENDRSKSHKLDINRSNLDNANAERRKVDDRQAANVGSDSAGSDNVGSDSVGSDSGGKPSMRESTTDGFGKNESQPVSPEKSKSFAQKIAERVSRRGSARKEKPHTDDRQTKQPVIRSESLTKNQQTLPAKPASAKPESKHTVGDTSSEAIDKPKIDRQSSSILTELVARVKNPEPIEQQNLLALFRSHDFKFHRKVHIYGLNQLTDLWRDIEFEMPSARFVELGVSIQLADRDGAMSEKELHDFQQMTLEFSNSFDAPFEFSMDIDGALKQAQLLDQIGRRYDSMAVLNVVPKTKSGFKMADLESCARDLMMSTDKNGIFMKTQGQKHDVSVLYRLACTDGSGHFGLSSNTLGPVHDLVVYMNVPATSDPESVFQQMVKDANSLATWLDGKVVDRAGRAMTQRSYSTLMQQISDIAFSMQQDGLIPGDEISKKLF